MCVAHVSACVNVCRHNVDACSMVLHLVCCTVLAVLICVDVCRRMLHGVAPCMLHCVDVCQLMLQCIAHLSTPGFL